MLLSNNRIEIDARPTPPATTLLEVVMIGHAPGRTEWQRLATDPLLLAEISSLGFSRHCSRLRELAAGSASTVDDIALLSLYNLPIPLYSFGQFQALFPAAFNTSTHYRSVLAGKHAWLPLAVQDFFENGSGQPLKLWIIRVDEEKGQQPFLPTPGANMVEPESLGAFERTLLIPQAAILALPDLERLQIPSHLEDAPRLHIKNSLPAFLPCGTEPGHTPRERNGDDGIPEMAAPLSSSEVIIPIIRTLAQLRPDIQCLLTVALAAIPGRELPGPSKEFINCISQAAGVDDAGLLNSTARSTLNNASRHLQLLYPYLRGADRRLGTPVGVIAGMQAAVSQQYGPWRSIGGRPLPGRCLPWPPINQQGATALRNRPGVTVLLHRAGKTVVDDERICAPSLPAVALLQLTQARRNEEQWRSAEIMRFNGWLQRELQRLGEQMIFSVDPRDPRPELALRAFFTRLHIRGALRGRQPEDSFSLNQRYEGDNVIAFDIEIAPAYPIDKIRITFMQDRNSTTAEVTHV